MSENERKGNRIWKKERKLKGKRERKDWRAMKWKDNTKEREEGLKMRERWIGSRRKGEKMKEEKEKEDWKVMKYEDRKEKNKINQL